MRPDCSDTGSAYGLVIEYSRNRAMFEDFVSDGATRQALLMVGNDAEVGNKIQNFAGDGRPSLGSVDLGGVTIERCPPRPLPAD